MTNKYGDLEKRICIKKILQFLEQNKELIKVYQNQENFKKNINNLYNNLKRDVYDCIEFDIPENIEVLENAHYYYYSKSNVNGTQDISIINKNLDEYYFFKVNSYVNYEIINYYQICDSEIIVIKNNRDFNSIREANDFKSLILRPIKTTN